MCDVDVDVYKIDSIVTRLPCYANNENGTEMKLEDCGD